MLIDEKLQIVEILYAKHYLNIKRFSLKEFSILAQTKFFKDLNLVVAIY